MKQKSKEKSISLIDFVFYFMMGNDMLTLSKYFSYFFGKKLGFLRIFFYHLLRQQLPQCARCPFHENNFNQLSKNKGFC